MLGRAVGLCYNSDLTHSLEGYKLVRTGPVITVAVGSQQVGLLRSVTCRDSGLGA